MVTILNRNLQPHVPDEFEQRLQNQVDIASIYFHGLLFSCAGGELSYVVLTYLRGYLDIQNLTFFDYYYMFMTLYCLFFILLPILFILQGHLYRLDMALYIFALSFLCFNFSLLHAHFQAAKFFTLGVVLFYHYFYGFSSACNQICNYYLDNQSIFIVICCLCVYQAYQWYIASKDLKLYQHGNRHRLSIIPRNIRGA